MEVLIRWKHLPDYEASWESAARVQDSFPEFHLEDKVAVKGGGGIDSTKPIISKVYRRRNKSQKGVKS